MKHIKIRILLALVLGLFIILSNCKENNEGFIPIQTYHYKFLGIDSVPSISSLFEKVLEELFKHDYMITTHEVLMRIEKDVKIPYDSASNFHKYIHRVELLDSNKTYKLNNKLMIIKYISDQPGATGHLHYYQYHYTENEKWVQKLDLGKHSIPVFSDPEKQVDYLILEMARASFK